MSAQPLEFTLSNDEQVVRTYECTMLQKLFSPPTFGYLTITNKRVAYHSHGKSLSGESTLVSEMPLDDVAGISAMVGASINWIFALIFVGVLYFATSFLFGLLPRFLTHWFVGILLLLPFGIAWLFEKNVLNKDLKEQLLKNVYESPVGGYLKQRDSEFYKGVFRILLHIGVVLVVWNIVIESGLLYYAPIVAYALILGVNFWIYMMYFGRQRTFSLVITSKTSESSGIFIPGDVFSIVWGRDTTALQSLNAGPARDAEIIVKELGALLTDIRLMGDMGIQKWKG